jgi:hypothetical protein
MVVGRYFHYLSITDQPAFGEAFGNSKYRVQNTKYKIITCAIREGQIEIFMHCQEFPHRIQNPKSRLENKAWKIISSAVVWHSDQILAEAEKRSWRKSVAIESAYVWHIWEGKNLITMPQGLQMAHEKAREDLESAEGAWEAGEKDWAMVTVMDAAECLNPTYEEARRQSDWPKWQEAIQAELRSLEANKTWSVVERPKDTNVVSLKWVLHIKKNAAGEIEKFKARLVACGFTQIHGINYYETYAPVARLASFCLLLAMANRNGWPADSFDFDLAYLNSVLSDNKVIYLEQHPQISSDQSRGGGGGHNVSWINPRKQVLQLHKALYGLKQGG